MAGVESEAIREEYRAIVAAGFILQIDDPALVDIYDWWYSMNDDIAGYRKWAAFQVEALNHALEGIPEDRVRFHICWGSWHGPHKGDVPLKDIIDVVFLARPSGLSFEAANPRHAHEWTLFEEVRLPDGNAERAVRAPLPVSVSLGESGETRPPSVEDRARNTKRAEATHLGSLENVPLVAAVSATPLCAALWMWS